MLGFSEIRRRIKNGSLYQESRYAFQPLVGTYDGVTRVFTTPYSPIDTDSVKLYDYDYAEILTGWSVADDKSGTILFTEPPVDIVYATFSVVDIPNSVLDGFIEEGFTRMQTKIWRNIHLFDNGSERVVSGSSTAEIDPTFQGRLFSADQSQVGFLMLFVELSILNHYYVQSLSGAASYREERSGGLMVDTTKAPAQWAEAIKEVEGRISAAIVDIDGSYGYMVGGSRYENPDGTHWNLADGKDWSLSDAI